MTSPELEPLERFERIRRLRSRLRQDAQVMRRGPTQVTRDESTRAFVRGVDQLLDLMNGMADDGTEALIAQTLRKAANINDQAY